MSFNGYPKIIRKNGLTGMLMLHAGLIIKLIQINQSKKLTGASLNNKVLKSPDQQAGSERL